MGYEKDVDYCEMKPLILGAAKLSAAIYLGYQEKVMKHSPVAKVSVSAVDQGDVVSLFVQNFTLTNTGAESWVCDSIIVKFDPPLDVVGYRLVYFPETIVLTPSNTLTLDWHGGPFFTIGSGWSHVPVETNDLRLPDDGLFAWEKQQALHLHL